MTKGQQTRQSIVEAAAPIFNERGYEGTSLNDLMEATGLQKGGIYRHFSSKEELAAAAFDYTWEAAWNLRVDVDESANGIEQLKQIVTNFVERRPPIRGGCPLLNTAVEADDGNLVLRGRASQALRMFLNRLKKIVTVAKERGEVRKGADAAAVATLMVATLEGALMMSRLQRSNEPLQAARKHLNEYLEREAAV